MPRWEHGSAERLKRAALELFDEQGFEATSAVQIAARAGVTTRTFFRYFPDKEEVLFAEAGALHEALVRGLEQSAGLADPLVAVTRALSVFDWSTVGPVDVQRRRTALIAANPRLLERELAKQQQMTDSLADVLRRHGVDPDAAELAANTGVQVFRLAYRQWLEDGGDLTTRTEAVLALLAGMMPRITAG